MNLLTIIVLAVFVIFILIGYSRGLFRSVFKLLLAGISLVVAYLCTPLIASAIIEYTPIDEYVNEKVYEGVENIARDRVKKELGENVEQVSDEVVDGLTEIALGIEPNRNQQVEIIKQLKLPTFMTDALITNNNDDVRSELGADGFYRYLAYYISYMIINAGAFIVTFTLINLLANVIYIALGIVSKLPIIGGIDKLGGLLLGGVEALLIAWIILIVISMFANTEIGNHLYTQVNESSFLTFLHDHNIFNKVIVNIGK